MQTQRQRVEAEMRAHPGLVAHVRWQALRRIVEVHARNGRELLGLLQRMATDPALMVELIQNVHAPDVADEINAQIDQRLHNYVASTASLIDHSRNLFKHYEGQHVAAEYESRKDVLAAEPVTGFVRDLRNYALHSNLPWVVHKVSFAGGAQGGTGPNMAAVTSLITAELLAWDPWNAPAKAFLRQAGETVDIRSTIEQHVTLIQALYVWVFAQFKALHGADVAGLNSLSAEFNWTISGGREGRPRPGPAPTTGAHDEAPEDQRRLT